MTAYDVYSYGMVSSSTWYNIRGEFPAPEGYAEIADVEYMTGGEACNSSIVLARLGARVRLDGNWLGSDEGGERTKTLLSTNNIDTSRLPLKDGYKGASEIIFATPSTRTIFGTYGRLLDSEEWNTPNEEDVTQAEVICLDPFFKESSSRVAQIAHQAEIPVVTVDCRFDDPILQHCAAVVIAESFIRENYEDRQVDDLFGEYQRSTGGLVIFTFGDSDVWYAGPDEVVKTFQPYSVEAIDTTGGGDSFRAGVVFGFLKGWDDAKTIAFASATAALVCTRSPGVLNAPSYDEVLALMDAGIHK